MLELGCSNQYWIHVRRFALPKFCSCWQWRQWWCEWRSWWRWPSFALKRSSLSLSLYSSDSKSVGFAGLVAMMSVLDEADVVCSSAGSYRLKLWVWVYQLSHNCGSDTCFSPLVSWSSSALPLEWLKLSVFGINGETITYPIKGPRP